MAIFPSRKTVKDMTLKVHKVLAKELLGDIRWVSARYNAENTPDICMEGTRVEIINDIVTRLTSAPDPSQRVVMLSGSAGSGKSTIAKTIASILAENKNILAASFFFSRDYVERREIKFLPGTIARQLADYSRDYERLLLEFVDSDRTEILSADPYLQFQKIIIELLAKCPLLNPHGSFASTHWMNAERIAARCFFRWLSDSISQTPTHIRFF
ncbi:hypothetical protein B0H13DRAFT_2332290 [Mycena leptocephala]|nr:hypothetical protein B0H13DRAFT_2332290 [Mycena leptocephala]